MSLHWLEPTLAAPPANLAAAVGDPLVAAALVRRGIADPDAARAFLDPDLYHPADPFDLPDMDRAVARLRRAIERQERIAIWGDFDVDGQTATALLVEGLRALGADPLWTIPDRLSEGHGIHIPALGRLIDAGARLLVTCDTGVAAHEAIDYAKSRGMDAIVTDHHQLTDLLPAAEAVVHPLRLPEDHPMRTLPGVGAALQVIRALAQSSNADPALIDRLVDLAALGIVADVAVQTGDARCWLQLGLRLMRRSLRPGLAALAEAAALEPSQINEGHIAFILAPRLNAAGRLDSAALGVELLMARDLDSARTIALKLEGLNAQRKLLCDQIESAAEAQIARDPALRSADALVLSGDTWHTGVVGIVASRLSERYNVPVVLLAAPPGEEARGSARSVAGVDITAALAANAHLLNGYGGHVMAAGLRLAPENIAGLRRSLGRTVRAMRGEVPPGTLSIDAETTLPALTLDLVASLERLAPFGAGNPAVVLALRDLRLRESRLIGRDKSHRTLSVEDLSGTSARVVWWNSAALPLPEGRFDIACTVRASDFRGERRVEIELLDWQPARPSAEAGAALTIIDHRSDTDPQASLALLGGALVYREGGDSVAGSSRLELRPADTLVIWSAPPNRASLRALLDQVQPRIVHIFAVDPPYADGDSFLLRLLGLAKFALQHRGGAADRQAVAAALAATGRAVDLGLAALEARGALVRVSDSAEGFVIAPGTGELSPDAPEQRARLNAALEEMRAFRAHLRQTSALEALFR